MKIQITLDRIDGSKSKAVDMHLDELDLAGLRMMLTSRGNAGITITRKDVLRQLRREIDDKDPR